MKSRFAVIGLGRFGGSVATNLARWNYEVLGVDRDESRVKLMSTHLARAVQADAANPRVFRSLKLSGFDTAVVAMGSSLEPSILVTTMLKQGQCPRVVAKAASDLHASVLKLVGADQVVLPEREMGSRVARNLALPNILDYLALAPGYRVVEARAPVAFHGRSLGDLDLGAGHGLNVVAVLGAGGVEVAPPASHVVRPGDVLVVVGREEHLKLLNQV
ncbi:MAG: TrkA family potassium uptake protein [bacterium]|nr:TrkA family potassium uptake protein [bacterium]